MKRDLTLNDHARFKNHPEVAPLWTEMRSLMALADAARPRTHERRSADAAWRAVLPRIAAKVRELTLADAGATPTRTPVEGATPEGA